MENLRSDGEWVETMNTRTLEMDYESLGLSPDNLKPLYTGSRTVDFRIQAVSIALRTAFETGEKISALALSLEANKDLLLRRA